ncbi:hypothetical protein HCU64_15760 [Methylobacterium sp. C25]|uniref:hypothetical protein n=1 Tax=Methylobacterium sp. C25 TaxID=2721622 RepID=UPI001F3243EF|nr:hypothetical protein [Methylobacterium sp. C25]MCE4225212.1 hypothetical protein [Methylobacterium sp. C25]
MIKQIFVAAILAVGATSGALAQTRTINVWGAQLEVPTYGAPAPAAPSAMQAAERFDRNTTTFTAMHTRDGRSQSRNR